MIVAIDMEAYPSAARDPWQRDRRLGRWRFSSDFRDDPGFDAAALLIQRDVVVIDVRFFPDRMECEYLGRGPVFDIVPYGLTAPEYRAIITSRNNRPVAVAWERVDPTDALRSLVA